MNYVENCEFTLENFINDFYCIYAFAHFFGWFFSSFIARNLPFLMIWQLQDELVELSYKNIYYAFEECWWNSVIIDIFMCNIVGLLLGFFFLKWLGLEKFEFFGMLDEKG